MTGVVASNLEGVHGLPTHKTTLFAKLRSFGLPERTRPVRGGHAIEFDIDGLPADMRATILRDLHGLEPIDENAGALEEFVNEPRAWKRKEAERRLAIVLWIEDRIKAGNSKGEAIRAACQEFSSVESSICEATCKNYLRAVRGKSRAAYLAALMPNYKPGKSKAEIQPEIERFFISYKGRPENPTFHKCYIETRKTAETHKWGKVPSEKTLTRLYKAIPAGQRAFYEGGSKKLDRALPTHHRDRSETLALDGVNYDSRVWDNFVKMPDGRIIRLTIVCIQDEATGYPLAWHWAETESSDLYLAVTYKWLKEIGWVAGKTYARFDNTLAANNRNLTGGALARNRKEAKERPQILGLLPFLGINARYTQPERPTGKVVERTWLEWADYSEKDIRLAGSYTGKDPTAKPENYQESAVPLDTFLKVIEEALDYIRTRTDRRGSVAFGRSLKEIFEEGYAPLAVTKLTDAQRRLFFTVAEQRTVTPKGEIILGKRPHQNFYYHRDLLNYAGKNVTVRFDPEDYKKPIIVMDDEGNILVRQVPRTEKVGFNNRNQQRAHERARRAEMRAIQEAAKQRDLMTQIEMQALVGDAPPAPEIPSPQIIQPLFGKMPSPASKKKQPTASSPAEPSEEQASVLEDPAFDEFINRAGKLKRSFIA
jgi:hypothetical protein